MHRRARNFNTVAARFHLIGSRFWQLLFYGDTVVKKKKEILHLIEKHYVNTTLRCKMNTQCFYTDTVQSFKRNIV